jgi:glycosyltransferase involved in cell wall biosynthesis
VVPYTNRPFDYYLNADVFVFSSLMEGLGTAVIEAMASGIPVVAYDIPPVREATGNGRFAYLTPVGDPAAMAKAAVDVLEGNADDRSQRATAWVKDAYSLPRIASQLESRLRELATSGSLSI